MITKSTRGFLYFAPPFNGQFKPENFAPFDRLQCDESLTYDAGFQIYGLGKNFRGDLQTDTADFANSMSPSGSMIGGQVAGTAEIGEAVRRGMIARRILEGVVKNKYRGSVGKLAAWLSASHIEKTPKSGTPTA